MYHSLIGTECTSEEQREQYSFSHLSKIVYFGCHWTFLVSWLISVFILVLRAAGTLFFSLQLALDILRVYDGLLMEHQWWLLPCRWFVSFILVHFDDLNLVVTTQGFRVRDKNH